MEKIEPIRFDQPGYENTLDPKVKQRIQKQLSQWKTGLHATAPIYCRGPNSCPFIKHCPIPETIEQEINFGPLEWYPINQPCVMEQNYIRQKLLDYQSWLQVDQNNPIEMGLINELSLIDLYKNRAAMLMSTGDRDGQGMDFLRQDVTGFQDNGNGTEYQMEAKSTQLHPVMDVMDRLEKRREKILIQLQATRKQQTELAIKMGKRKEDSQLLEEIKKMRELLTKAQEEPIKLLPEKELLLKD